MSRTHRGTCEIVVSDERDTEYSLSVQYSLTAGCPEHYNAWFGWIPPERPELEICDCRCSCVTFNNSMARPARTIEISIPPEDQEGVGDWCRETFEDDINEQVLEYARQSAMQTHDPRI